MARINDALGCFYWSILFIIGLVLISPTLNASVSIKTDGIVFSSVSGYGSIIDLSTGALLQSVLNFKIV